MTADLGKRIPLRQLPEGCAAPVWRAQPGRIDSWTLTRPSATIGPLYFGQGDGGSARAVLAFWRECVREAARAAGRDVSVQESCGEEVHSCFLWDGDRSLVGTAIAASNLFGETVLTIVNSGEPEPAAAGEGASYGAREEQLTEEVGGEIASIKEKVAALFAGAANVQTEEALKLATVTIGLAGKLVDMLVHLRRELEVTFTYSNHRGVVEKRRVRILGLRLGSSVHYTERQWLLRAWCYDRRAERDFALAKILDYPG